MPGIPIPTLSLSKLWSLKKILISSINPGKHIESLSHEFVSYCVVLVVVSCHYVVVTSSKFGFSCAIGDSFEADMKVN